MHDCPTCRVPLHGWEENCPSCGTRQYVRKDFGPAMRIQKEPGINFTPFIVVIVLTIAGLVVVSQSTWVGQLMKQGPQEEDPIAKMTYLEARQVVESEIAKGLAAVGAKGTFNWQVAGAPADKSADGPVELTIDTELTSPDLRKQIIDPVKPYMAQAKIPTLVMNDAKSHATWTYTVTMPSAASEGGEAGQ